MKYSYGWLKEYVSKIPEPKKLADLIMMRAFEVESVEKAGNDYVLDIKVLPNRAFDCLSHIGMAREIGAVAGIKYNVSSIKYREEKKLKINNFLRIEVEDRKLCPRYSARVMVDVKVGESPKWIQERLVACGLRPINNIVDITNYIMLETGQPMHVFDFDKLIPTNYELKPITNKKIIVRRAREGEKITTLDDVEYKLNEDILVIADLPAEALAKAGGKEPLALAGIKGGKKAEIDKNTKIIVLEAANFDSANIRKSSRTLNLRTDSSARFENGLDINLTEPALNRAAVLIQKTAGGNIVSGIADVCSVKSQKITTAVSYSYIENLLGIKIASKDILNIFKRLQLPVRAIRKKEDIFYEIFAPGWRSDLQTSEDLIEEIGRLYGYEKILTCMPDVVLAPALKNDELIFEDRAKDILVGAGYSEVYNYSLISEADKEKASLSGNHLLGPRNPLSREQKHLRPLLTLGLFKNARENLKYFDDIRIFEIGKAFIKNGKKVVERKKLAGALSRKNIKHAPQLFYEAKGIVDLLTEKMGVAGVWYDDYISRGSGADLGISRGSDADLEISRGSGADLVAILHPSRRAQIKVGDTLIGWLGEIDWEILKRFDIKNPIAVFEIDLEGLIGLAEDEIAYLPPSKYPAIARDITAIVDFQTKIDQVANIIENTGGKLIMNVDLIDFYEPSFATGGRIRTGRGGESEEKTKSLTFRIIYQSSERNLSDAEVNKIQDKIIGALGEKGWEVRK